jgi:hypothetical protein
MGDACRWKHQVDQTGKQKVCRHLVGYMQILPAMGETLSTQLRPKAITASGLRNRADSG